MNFAKEIAGFPGLMETSAEQLRKVPALTGTAILTALSVVVGTPFIPITPTLRTGLSSIPVAACGMYYGLICAGFAGVIADTLRYIIRPDGPYFPGFAANKFLIGMICGCLFYKKKITLPRVIIARACIIAFINLILTLLWLNMMYQSPSFTMARLIKNVATSPVDVVLLYAALKDTERVHRA